MKNFSRYIIFAILLAAFSVTAFADVKIKSRQTASGQTFENTIYIKGKRQRSEQNTGMQMITLTQCDLKRGVQINPAAKTYVINLFEQNKPAGPNPQSEIKNDGVVRAGGTITNTVTYKDTGETKKIFGYTARRIITTIETVSSPDACSPLNSKMEIDGWYIDAAFALDCEINNYAGFYKSESKGGCQDKYQTKTTGNGKRGFPVYEKTTIFDPNSKRSFSMVNEVTEISQATLDAALFEIPADYREVKDMSQLYSASNVNSTDAPGDAPTSGTVANIKNQARSNSETAPTVSAKKEGIIRIGMVSVKTGSVGDGISASDLALAIQNTLGEFLKGTKIELIHLEARLASAIDAEAAQKECDFILHTTVSHKKGGGGFGMFGSAVAQSIGRVGIGQTGSRVGNAVGQVAAQTIVAAGAMSANVKSKDEITLDIKLQQAGGTAVISKQFKAKAKSDGEDIITTVVEQAAQAVSGAANK